MKISIYMLVFYNYKFITLKKINQAVTRKFLVTRALLKSNPFHYSTRVFKRIGYSTLATFSTSLL